METKTIVREKIHPGIYAENTEIHFHYNSIQPKNQIILDNTCELGR